MILTMTITAFARATSYTTTPFPLLMASTTMISSIATATSKKYTTSHGSGQGRIFPRCCNLTRVREGGLSTATKDLTKGGQVLTSQNTCSYWTKDTNTRETKLPTYTLHFCMILISSNWLLKIHLLTDTLKVVYPGLFSISEDRDTSVAALMSFRNGSLHWD